MSDYSPISRPVPMYKETLQNLTFDYLESGIHSLECALEWAIPFNIGTTPPIEGPGYPMGGGLYY